MSLPYSHLSLTSILARFQSLVQLVITCGNDIVHELRTLLASILFLLHLNVHSTSKTRFNVFLSSIHFDAWSQNQCTGVRLDTIRDARATAVAASRRRIETVNLLGCGSGSLSVSPKFTIREPDHSSFTEIGLIVGDLFGDSVALTQST